MYLTKEQFEEYFQKTLSECFNSCSKQNQERCKGCEDFYQMLKETELMKLLFKKLLGELTKDGLTNCFADAINLGYTIGYEHASTKKLEDMIK